MSRIYRTSEGEMLDAICAAELGTAAHVADVLGINPHLSSTGLVYPAGVLIVLPDLGAPVPAGQIRLWGRSRAATTARVAADMARPHVWRPDIVTADDGLTPITGDDLAPIVVGGRER